MRLSLVFPAWCQQFGPYRQVARRASSFPPLNLCIVAALAEQAGWEVQVIDAEAEGLAQDAAVDRAAAFHPDLVGLTATSPFFHLAAATARLLKHRLAVPVMVGGPHVSILRDQAFLDCFDYLVVGECETTLPRFLEAFAAGRRAVEVPGIMTRRGDEVRYGGDAPLLDDLDLAPLPARHLLRTDRYCLGTMYGPKRYTSVQMTRGCPFRCVFCANSLHGNTVRRRSLDGVMDEIERIVGEMGIRHVYFVDDTLTLDRGYILALCDRIRRRGLRFTFEGGTRANLWDRALAGRLREAGLIRVSFGLESADPAVHRIIRKAVPLDAYLEANRINNALGIETINSVMLGLPGETRRSMRRTVDFLCRSRDIHHATYGIAVPYPGTEMLEMARKGLHGLRLVDEDLSHYQRYGSAVMEVNGVTPAELIEMQKQGLRRIYSCWWRIVPMLRRHGLRALVPPIADAARARVRKWLS